MTTRNKLIVAALLIILGVSCRLLPHPFNFAPIAAVALFSAVYLGAMYAVTLPVIAMVVGDIFIGFYEWQLMVAVYLCYAIIGLLGLIVRRYKSVETVLGASIGASVLFFIVTNLAVWYFSPWYGQTMQGLVNCYIVALPFFRNTIMGDMFYVGAFFGSYELVKYGVLKRQIQASIVK
ncbi:hypothetical protein KKA15_05580 [Patescibacteria group bacterium]|nr:hypothetical protein [Patescibacteria group bacterium]